MIVINAENIRLFAIMVLGIIWLYLLVETLAVDSVENEKKRRK
tara:strand:- start:3936 stop:4064 length:129 start_codon:yes stop_codon:yes gene_type:complete